MMVRGPLKQRSLISKRDLVVSNIECGSRGLPGCKDGFICVKAPGASCGPEMDCGGVCVKKKNQKTDALPKAQCGSRGLPNCEPGLKCVRFPGRSCGPETDCGGMCIKDNSPELEARSLNIENEATMRPPTIQCYTGGKQCPSSQTCISEQCIGSSCYLRAPKESDKTRCPAQQTCVQRPRKDGKVIFDVAGVCASDRMECRSNAQCPKEWICQMRPNGDGPLCGGIDNCGLCAPVT
jgi:hypothetical protein